MKENGRECSRIAFYSPQVNVPVRIFIQQIPNLPTEYRDLILAWPELRKSPYSRSFYSSTAKRWDFTPDGCERISDHCNFRSKGRRHCCTDVPVRSGSHWTHAIYSHKKRQWVVQSSVTKQR